MGRRGTKTMNKQQRNQWDKLVTTCSVSDSYEFDTDKLILAANAYIMKLERELQNIRGHKRIARVLMPKQEV